MASFAEMLTQSASEQQQKIGGGLAGAITQGIGLAQEAERIQIQRQQMEQQKAQLQQAKLSKFAEAVEKGQQYSGKAQSNYYNKFLPSYRDALGISRDQFSDDALSFITSSPDNLNRLNTIIADVRSGRMTEQDALAAINDPTKFADVQFTPELTKRLEAASKTAIENRQELTKQTRQFAQQTQEKATERDMAAEQEAKKKTADAFVQYKNAGGESAYSKAIEGYRAAIEKLRKGEVQFGTLAKKIPGMSSETMLSKYDEKAKALLDSIRSSINIRASTGDPNPTEKQIEAVLSRSIDPQLSNEANIQKLEREIVAMEGENADKKALFNQYGFKVPAQAPKTYTLMGKKFNLEQLNAIKKRNPALTAEINSIIARGGD